MSCNIPINVLSNCSGHSNGGIQSFAFFSEEEFENMLKAEKRDDKIDEILDIKKKRKKKK